MRRNIFAIRRESSWFSAGDCFAMAASMSKSMPAQNAFPLPVTMATRAWLFSIWSSAVCSSAIICVEMALRFSGRFSVMVARFPAISRRSVEYMVGLLFNLQVVRVHTSREFHSSFRAPWLAAPNQFRDLRPPFARRQEHLPSRCSRPDRLLQTGSRQAPSARYRNAGTLPRKPRESFLPHFRAGHASARPIRSRRCDPSRCGTNRRRVAAKRCPPYPPAKPCAHEHPSATPMYRPQFPVPTVRRRDCQTPSKYKSPARGLPRQFLSSIVLRASAIHPASCWHSRAENTPKLSKDIQSSSRPASPARVRVLFRSRRFQLFPAVSHRQEERHLALPSLLHCPPFASHISAKQNSLRQCAGIPRAQVLSNIPLCTLWEFVPAIPATRLADTQSV